MAPVNIEATYAVDVWRLHVGRMPRALERQVYYLVGKYGNPRVVEAMEVVRKSGHRRTAERVTLFHAFLGEPLPTGEDLA
jgi:hypothetical protein